MIKKRVQDITVVDGTDGVINIAEHIELVYISGTDTLTGDWAVTANGTPLANMYVDFKFDGTIALGGNSIILLGTTIPDELAVTEWSAKALYKSGAWEIWISNDYEKTGIIATYIKRRYSQK